MRTFEVINEYPNNPLKKGVILTEEAKGKFSYNNGKRDLIIFIPNIENYPHLFILKVEKHQ